MNNEISKLQVSIIVPAYNEEYGISALLNDLLNVMKSRRDIEFEIIVVDDCSQDKTIEKIKKFTNKGIKLICQKNNNGYGAAIKTGIKKARYELIAIIDADGTYPANRLPGLINYTKNYDMVVGARNGRNVKVPFVRRLPKIILNKYANYLTDYNIPDLNSGLRVFHKDISERFKNLLCNGFSFTSTITVAMISNNYRIKYISIDYYKRKGKSKIRPIHDTINFFNLISRITLYFNPLKVFAPIALTFLTIGTTFLGYDLIFNKNISDKTILTFFLGMQFWLIGTLADIIIHQRQL
ncbi:glycosyltransferase family 2 protein [Patescibacteria group bacterium]